MWVAELLKEMKVLREEIGDGDGKIKRFLERWIQRLQNTRIRIVVDKLNATHDWNRPGKRGIWIELGSGLADDVLIQLGRGELIIVDHTRGNVESLRPPERRQYVIFDGSQVGF